MRKITEKEYKKWKSAQGLYGVDYQMSKLLNIVDELIINGNNHLLTLGIACSAMACNCRYLHDKFGVDLVTKYKWKELFEVEL